MKNENKRFAVLAIASAQLAQSMKETAEALEELHNEDLVVRKPRSLGPSTTTPYKARPEMFCPIGYVKEDFTTPKEYGKSLQGKRRQKRR